jgi:hypothetical protein
MPDAVADVRPQVDAGEHDVDVLPEKGAQCDAICRGSIDAVRIELAQLWRATVREWPRMGDRMTHRGLLDIRGHDPDLAKARRHLGERREPGTVDAIIVGNQNSHGDRLRALRSSGASVEAVENRTSARSTRGMSERMRCG